VLGDTRGDVMRQLQHAAQPRGQPGAGEVPVIDATTQHLSLASTYLAVRDDEDEVVARVGCAALAYPTSCHADLLSLCLARPDQTAVVVVLDWQRPWQFVSLLRRWMSLLRAALDASADPIVLCECRERRE